MAWKKSVTGKQQSFPLENSIEELDNLISDKGRIEQDSIPVLDDIIDPETYVEDEPVEPVSDWAEMRDSEDTGDEEHGLSHEQIEMLVGKMDQRISGELEELVNILKDALKDSIITEIKTQLESNSRENPAEDPDPEKDDRI